MTQENDFRMYHSEGVTHLSDEERAERLAQASALVGEVMSSLERRGAKCDHCGNMRYRNWSHHLRAGQLKAMVEKLDRLVGSFRSDAGKGEATW
jgi:hypothetical protein